MFYLTILKLHRSSVTSLHRDRRRQSHSPTHILGLCVPYLALVIVDQCRCYRCESFIIKCIELVCFLFTMGFYLFWLVPRKFLMSKFTYYTSYHTVILQATVRHRTVLSMFSLPLHPSVVITPAFLFNCFKILPRAESNQSRTSLLLTWYAWLHILLANTD